MRGKSISTFTEIAFLLDIFYFILVTPPGKLPLLLDPWHQTKGKILKQMVILRQTQRMMLDAGNPFGMRLAAVSAAVIRATRMVSCRFIS